MVRFSPRSYVFEGLQLIRKPLRNFIWEIFKSSDEDWWYKYIYNLLNENKYYRGKVPISGKYTDLSQLDVLYYFKIIEKNPKLFKDVVNIDYIRRLHKIRNDCVHICREFIIFDKISRMIYYQKWQKQWKKWITNVVKSYRRLGGTCINKNIIKK